MSKSLPVGWKWSQLGDVADYINGRAFKPQDWGESGLPIIRIQNLNNTDASFNYFEGEVEDRYKVKDGDLLISWSASLDAFIWQRGAAVLNQHIFNVRENPNVITRKYLFYVVRKVMLQIRSQVHGATMQHITKPKFEAIPIPLPPLDEQRRIVAVLDKADALREKRRQAINKLDMLLQAVFLDMFGDPVKNPKGWRQLTFKSLLAAPLQNGTSPSTSGQVSRRVLTLSAITQGKFESSAFKEAVFAVDPLPNKAVNKLDFLICRGNGNLNLVGQGHFPDVDMNEVVFPDTMIAARIDPNIIRPEFLDIFWSTRGVRDQIERSARTTNGTHKINQTAIEDIIVINPPLSLQIRFSEQVNIFKRLEAKCTSSLKYLDNLFHSLQQRAFNGELFNGKAAAALPRKAVTTSQPELFD